MNLPKLSRIISLAIAPVLVLGLSLVFQPDQNKGKVDNGTPVAPKIMPYHDRESVTPPIVPYDNDPNKIQYRNILFNE
jgi:hypothetical protein